MGGIGLEAAENVKLSVTPFFLDRPIPRLVMLAEKDWFVNEPALPDGDEQTRLSAIHRPLAEIVYECARAGGRSANIVGDCCSTIGVLAGLQRAGIEPTLIWFDAHGDFNTHATSPSGFLGGMPLAMIAGRGDLAMSDAVDLHSHPEEKIILTDARDLDPEEATAVAGSAMNHVAQFDEMAGTPLPDGPLYVHFDTDIITSDEAPAQNYPVPGGPPAAQVKDVLADIAATGQVAAISMSAWNPDLDENGRTESVCLQAFRAMLA